MQLEFFIEIIFFLILCLCMVWIKLKFTNKLFIAKDVSLFICPDEKQFEEYKKGKSKKDKSLPIGYAKCTNK